LPVLTRVSVSRDGDPGHGDLNEDGFVDGLDLGILLGEWGPVPGGPFGPGVNSDFNLDGFVDGLDLGILLGAWDPPVRLGAASAVPEPTTATLLLTCCVLPAVARRRR